MSTNGSGGTGNGSSTKGRSTARGAAGPSPRAATASARRSTTASRATRTTRAGTSATPTKTARSTRARSTRAATGADRASAAAKKGARSGGRGAGKKPAPKGLPGARVLSIFGAFQSRVLVEMPVKLAAELFDGALVAHSRTAVVDAVERDVEIIRQTDPELADSALAAAALAMAYELENPYNSATSKSMCERALLETLDRLRERLPEREGSDALDELASRRAARVAGQSAT